MTDWLNMIAALHSVIVFVGRLPWLPTPLPLDAAGNTMKLLLLLIKELEFLAMRLFLRRLFRIQIIVWLPL